MRHVIHSRPPNSIVLIMDSKGGEIPESMGGRSIVATPSCVAVGTLCEIDGATIVSLADEVSAGAVSEPAFDDFVDTPSRELSVFSIQNESLATLQVTGVKTRVRIWTNDDSEPDRVEIVVT